MTKLMLNHRDF